MITRGARLTTRQLWVLRAVEAGTIGYNPLYGDLDPHILDGHSTGWTISTLALRGLVTFDPMLPGWPHLTRRGGAMLHAGEQPHTPGVRHG